MKAQHVHDTHGRKGDPVELRPLGHTGAYKQPAVGCAGNGQFIRGGVFLLDQVFGGSDEVIKDVLLFLQHPGLVPSLAVFTASPQVGHGVDAVVLEQDDVGDIEVRGGAGVEAAVGIKKGWTLSVEHEPFLVNDEHGDLGPVFARIEDLLGLIVVRIELDLGLAEDLGSSGRNIIFVDGRGVGE